MKKMKKMKHFLKNLILYFIFVLRFFTLVNTEFQIFPYNILPSIFFVFFLINTNKNSKQLLKYLMRLIYFSGYQLLWLVPYDKPLYFY